LLRLKTQEKINRGVRNMDWVLGMEGNLCGWFVFGLENEYKLIYFLFYLLLVEL
jgi:hypothetical protein